MRYPRNNNIKPELLLQPFDVMKFGSEDDPCFGKHYDLSTDECQSCGDQEICGISFMGRLKRKRIEAEKERPVKDLEIDDLEHRKDIRDFITKSRELGFNKKRTLKRLSKKFSININKVPKWIVEIL